MRFQSDAGFDGKLGNRRLFKSINMILKYLMTFMDNRDDWIIRRCMENK